MCWRDDYRYFPPVSERRVPGNCPGIFPKSMRKFQKLEAPAEPPEIEDDGFYTAHVTAPIDVKP